MKSRLDLYKVAPGAMKPLIDLEGPIQGSGLKSSLIDLVKIRASQINPCACCIHMHVPDAVYEEVRTRLGKLELMEPTRLVPTINAWNRIAVSFRSLHPVKPANASA